MFIHLDHNILGKKGHMFKGVCIGCTMMWHWSTGSCLRTAEIKIKNYYSV